MKRASSDVMPGHLPINHPLTLHKHNSLFCFKSLGAYQNFSVVPPYSTHFGSHTFLSRLLFSLFFTIYFFSYLWFAQLYTFPSLSFPILSTLLRYLYRSHLSYTPSRSCAVLQCFVFFQCFPIQSYTSGLSAAFISLCKRKRKAVWVAILSKNRESP